MISVIICSIDPGKLRTVRTMYEKALAGTESEFIAITDAKSLAEGYNRGVAQSRGDILIFSHDDIEILAPNLPEILRESFKECDLLGVAGTMKLMHPYWWLCGPPHVAGQVLHPSPDQPDMLAVQIYGNPSRCVRNMQALDGLFIAAKREVAVALPFDEKNFDGFHFYDVDFSFTAYLSGRKICVRNDLLIFHQSSGKFQDPKYKVYAERFLQKRASQLTNGPLWNFQWTIVTVRTVKDALEVMNPTYWDEKS